MSEISLAIPIISNLPVHLDEFVQPAFAAKINGAAIKLVLSPTPPVECLSTFTPGTEERSTVSPDWTMRSVRALTSRSVMPEKNTAIRNADI